MKRIDNLLSKNKSYRYIAREVLGRESRKSTIGDYVKRINNILEEDDSIKDLKLEGIQEDYKKAKILFIDIETAPLKASLWSMWQDGIALNQLDSDWYILSFTAKWADSDDIVYMDKRDSFDNEDDTEMLHKIWELLNEADYVAGHNTKRFDTKKINARFILNGYTKPLHYRHIDTLLIAKAIFGFTSNKLEYLTDKLCKKYKKLTKRRYNGQSLWTECLKGNQDAWEEMEEYNTFDVLSNQELYEILMPWDNKLPNFDVHIDNPKNILDEWVQEGFYYSNNGKYKRFRNIKTGRQMRGKVNLLSTEKRKTLLANMM